MEAAADSQPLRPFSLLAAGSGPLSLMKFPENGTETEVAIFLCRLPSVLARFSPLPQTQSRGDDVVGSMHALAAILETEERR